MRGYLPWIAARANRMCYVETTRMIRQNCGKLIYARGFGRIRRTNREKASIVRASSAMEGLEPRLFMSAAKLTTPKHAHHRIAAQRAPLHTAPAAVAAPSTVSASATTTNSVLVTWSNVATATSYNILRSVDGKKFSAVG